MSALLFVQVAEDTKAAMRNKDRVRLETLRMITNDIKMAALDKKMALPPSDDFCLQSILRMVKQRKDSIQQFEAADRAELAEKEKAQLAIIQAYLPQAMSEEETIHQVKAIIATLGLTAVSDMGKVMAEMKKLPAGQVDMVLVSKITKQLLS
jgi:uncharacterized protein YqeY